MFFKVTHLKDRTKMSLKIIIILIMSLIKNVNRNRFSQKFNPSYNLLQMDKIVRKIKNLVRILNQFHLIIFYGRIIAYGQTGSGKTYTLEGKEIRNSNDLDDYNCGIIPRTALHFLKEQFRLSVKFIFNFFPFIKFN